MIINWAQCKRFILDYAGKTRHQPFERVSPVNIVPRLEAALRLEMRKIVHEQPSKGVTIK